MTVAAAATPTRQEALDFVRRTGVTSLAVAIGTAHGVYHGVPKLDVERLKEIRALVDVPLVLHGASAWSDEASARVYCRGHLQGKLCHGAAHCVYAGRACFPLRRRKGV